MWFFLPVGPGDDHKVSAVSLQIVANDPVIGLESQAHIVQPAEGQLAFALRGGLGKEIGWRFLGQLLLQIQTADIERELGAKHGEKAQNMIVGLGERIGDKVEPLSLNSPRAFAPASSRGGRRHV